MNYRRFVAYNIIGGIGWVAGMTLVGYGLGSRFAPGQLDRYLHLIIGAVIILSILPPIVHAARERRRRSGSPLEAGGAPNRPLVASERSGRRE